MTLNLKEMRTRKALTQRQLAKRLGVTQGSVNKWETSLCWPSLPMFAKLCAALECTPNELLRLGTMAKADESSA